MSVHARLAAYYFAFFAHAGAFVSYFALYLTGLGLTAAEIALAIAMPQVARVVAPALWGWLADAWGPRYAGTRRAIVVFASFAYLAGFVALLFQERAGPIALTLLVMGLLTAGAAPLIEAITLGSLEGRTAQYGPIRIWGSIGFILAVLGTGAWLDVGEVATLGPILVALAALTCVAALAVPGGTGPRPSPQAARFGAVLARPEVLCFFGACFCMTAAHGAMYVFYTIYLESAGYSKSMIGALWTLGVVAEIVLFLKLPQILRRVSLRTLLLASFACAVLRFPVIGWGVELLALLAAAQLLHAATFGAFHAGALAAVHRLFPGALAARGQAVFSSAAYGLGGAAGSIVAGWSWVALGPAASFAVSALFAALGGAFVLWKVRV